MKALVLYHTAWMQMMALEWKQSGLLDDLFDLPLPVVDWDSQPDRKREIVGLIPRLIREAGCDLVVDVNGVGMLPLGDDPAGAWTVDSPAVWCVWWWDDPVNFVMQHRSHFERWRRALVNPNVRHFFWDATLAKEYSIWLGKRCEWLPTAVNPEAFSPDSAGKASRMFPPVDVSFLGNFYVSGEMPDTPEGREIEVIARRRVSATDRTYFDIVTQGRAELPLFSAILDRALKVGDGPFDTEWMAWRHRINHRVAVLRRTTPLEDLLGKVESAFFVGDNWPARFRAERARIVSPYDLSACYRSSVLGLDFSTGQSFTGSTMRCYEVMATGSVLACHPRPDFDPDGSRNGKAYVAYGSTDELVAQLARLKGDAAALCRLRGEARQYAAVNHSWTQRLSRLLDYVAADCADRCPRNQSLAHAGDEHMNGV